MEMFKSFKVKLKLFITFFALFTFATFILSCNSSQKNNLWSTIDPLPLDPEIEAQIDEILPKLTLEQKVGQVIQGDTGSLTPEDVKKYRLGSVLSVVILLLALYLMLRQRHGLKWQINTTMHLLMTRMLR